MKVYNKLVRDKIPSIIMADSGKSCNIAILDQQQYMLHLNAKLQEELQEYLASGDIEELADLEEVLRAILDVKGVTYQQFEGIRQDKVAKRGAFKDRILLTSVDD